MTIFNKCGANIRQIYIYIYLKQAVMIWTRRKLSLFKKGYKK